MMKFFSGLISYFRSIETYHTDERIEPEDFDEMINGYAEVLRFYAEELKKLSTIHVHDCMKINQTMLKMLVERELVVSITLIKISFKSKLSD